MPVLENPRWERFSRSVARGVSASKSYTSAGYSHKGAAASAHRLLTEAKVSERIRELSNQITSEVVKLEISDRSNRIAIYQDLADRMRMLIIARAQEMKGEVVSGETGLLARDYRGKDADHAIYKFDAAVIEKLNETLKQVAIESGQWIEKSQVKSDLSLGIIEKLQAGRRRVAEAAGKKEPA